MKKAKYLLIPVLVPLVVLVVSLYPSDIVTRQASAAPRAAVVTKYLMVPAAAFIARHDGEDYFNDGYRMGSASGTTIFVAPMYLPPGARIRMIKLFAKDSNPNNDLFAYLYETLPKIGGKSQIGYVKTTDSSGYQQPIKYLSHYVKWYYGYYILLNFPVSADLEAFAVMIKYTVNQ
jgi:hypothetical protein